ncbi:MAG TPA: hypothetical protein VG603_01450 [Chitinophagales bacterium]|nr:hypothetical protein [Chitinophagales bacterium]
MKPGEQAQIDFIVACLRNGESRKDIKGKFGGKWGNLSRNTFDRRLKAAKEAYSIEIGSIKAKAGQMIEQEAEVLKSKILTVLEKQVILSQIARGEIELQKPIVVDKSIELIKVVPDYMDRKNAIAELNKMEGHYAPAQIQQTITERTITLNIE